MNALVSFRLCTLTDEELLSKVDSLIDSSFRSGDFTKLKTRNIPARPNEDFDLLVGELIYRYNEKILNVEKNARPLGLM